MSQEHQEQQARAEAEKNEQPILSPADEEEEEEEPLVSKPENNSDAKPAGGEPKSSEAENIVADMRSLSSPSQVMQAMEAVSSMNEITQTYKRELLTSICRNPDGSTSRASEVLTILNSLMAYLRHDPPAPLEHSGEPFIPMAFASYLLAAGLRGEALFRKYMDERGNYIRPFGDVTQELIQQYRIDAAARDRVQSLVPQFTTLAELHAFIQPRLNLPPDSKEAIVVIKEAYANYDEQGAPLDDLVQVIVGMRLADEPQCVSFKVERQGEPMWEIFPPFCPSPVSARSLINFSGNLAQIIQDKLFPVLAYSPVEKECYAMFIVASSISMNVNWLPPSEYLGERTAADVCQNEKGRYASAVGLLVMKAGHLICNGKMVAFRKFCLELYDACLPLSLNSWANLRIGPSTDEFPLMLDMISKYVYHCDTFKKFTSCHKKTCPSCQPEMETRRSNILQLAFIKTCMAINGFALSNIITQLRPEWMQEIEAMEENKYTLILKIMQGALRELGVTEAKEAEVDVYDVMRAQIIVALKAFNVPKVSEPMRLAIKREIHTHLVEAALAKRKAEEEAEKKLAEAAAKEEKQQNDQGESSSSVAEPEGNGKGKGKGEHPEGEPSSSRETYSYDFKWDPEASRPLVVDDVQRMVDSY